MEERRPPPPQARKKVAGRHPALEPPPGQKKGQVIILAISRSSGTPFVRISDLDPAEQGFVLDPDGDRLANGLEAWFGTHPGEFTPGLAGLATDGTITSFIDSAWR
jgi:hypothetical protein